MTIPVIEVNENRKCKYCGKGWAAQGGVCLSCAADRITKNVRRESAGKEKRVGVEYVEVSEVGQLGRRIINEHHHHLRGARVEFVVAEKRDKDGTVQPAFQTEDGYEFGDTKVVKGLNAFLSREPGGEAEDYFVVVVCAFMWRSLPAADREAHLDHYVTRCALHEEKGTPVKRKPDVIEFGEVLKRRGLYRPNLKTFVEIGAKQLKLDLAPEKKKAASKNGSAKRASAPAGR